MAVITITNNRGGVGKSTTAQTLSIGLAQKGKKVLLIDLDPQCNTSTTFRVNQAPNNIYNVLKGECKIQEAIYKNNYIDLISSSINLVNADDEFKKEPYLYNMQYLLKNEVDKIKESYDYIIYDTPPTLGILTINALVSSNYVIIPMLADIYSVQGLNVINNQIKAIKERTTNKSIQIKGLLITHYKANTLINQGLRDSVNDIAKTLNTKVYNSVIRDSIIFSESQLNNTVCLLRYPHHNATIDYINFINQFLEEDKGNE